MISKKICKQNIHLTLKNHAGSVEHYYHFLLGFLVPLVLWEGKFREEASKRVYVRSCGIMDKHLFAIGIDGINIVDKVLHKKMQTRKLFTRGYSFIEHVGYDDPSHYNFADFSAASLALTEIFSEDIVKHSEKLNSNKVEDQPCIIMIDREPPDPFYLSSSCEIRGAGKSRRSIPNFDELFMLACSKHKNVMSIVLEGKSLAFQIALFNYADIIIAQHGAALANLIWCRPNTTLIEIVPSDQFEIVKNRGYFVNLANCMNLQYTRVEQNESHSSVAPNSFLHILKAVIGS